MVAAIVETPAVDPSFARRVDRDRLRARARPPDIEDALQHPSKQFQLWEVDRPALDDVEKVAKERIDFPRFRTEAPPLPGVGRRRAAGSDEMARILTASAIAAKAFRGFRALLRTTLAKPFRPAR